MKNVKPPFMIVLQISEGMGGVIRASLRMHTTTDLEVARHRWEWPVGRMTISQLNDIAAAIQDLTYNEVLVRYGAQSALDV